MLIKLLALALFVLVIVVTILALRLQHYKEDSHYKTMEYNVLHNKYIALEEQYTAYVKSVTDKKKVKDETEQKLTDIANGSVDDSIMRLQNRKNNRRNKSSGS